jgi:transcriptional regulator with XRE-family HTH domain
MHAVNQRQLRAGRRELLRALGRDFRRAREDAGRSQAVIASAAGMSQAHLSRIEAGNAEPSIEAVMAVAAALGCDLSLRLFPNTGPRIRDRLQVAMSEALIELLHPRWMPHPEVPVYRPVRGVIDIVLADSAALQVVATELHSQLRRIEQQIRWSVQKADALAALPEFGGARVGRLIVVRNSAAIREAIKAAEQTIRAAYPARSADAIASLASDRPWPGNAIIWANGARGRATILDGPPRGIAVGR